jgi:acetyl esterase/lipase
MSDTLRVHVARAIVRVALDAHWFVTFATRGRTDIGLDRQLAAILELARIVRVPDLATLTPAQARALADTSLADTDLPHLPMAEVIDTTVGEHAIPVRMFVPPDASEHRIVYFHGGGGVIGSIAASEAAARYLAATTRCTVASVGYRLAPEYKHPTAIDDACAAWDTLAAGARGKAIVAGDSFGAFLATHVERHARRAGGRRADLQVLVYPLLDLTLTSPSIERLGTGYLLTRAMMEWFRDHYAKPGDDHVAASPWFWHDLSGAAPAIIATAGFDPLVDEGRGWVRRLRAAGVRVVHHHHEPLIHSFLSFAGVVRTARIATDRLCAEIVRQL